MEPSEAGASPTAAPADRLEKLSTSARGWHTIQMAVLGFIGICGILRTASSPAPRAVQWLAAALAVAALAAACVAIFTVGRVAYPVGDVTDGASAVPGAAGAAARLRTGIRLTIVALILAVIAALSGWWPAASTTVAVAVTATTSGQALVRPARQRASRCHQRPYHQRRRHRARPGHRPGPPRRAVLASLPDTRSPPTCSRIPAPCRHIQRPLSGHRCRSARPRNAPEPPLGAATWSAVLAACAAPNRMICMRPTRMAGRG